MGTENACDDDKQFLSPVLTSSLNNIEVNLVFLLNEGVYDGCRKESRYWIIKRLIGGSVGTESVYSDYTTRQFLSPLLTRPSSNIKVNLSFLISRSKSESAWINEQEVDHSLMSNKYHYVLRTWSKGIDMYVLCRTFANCDVLGCRAKRGIGATKHSLEPLSRCSKRKSRALAYNMGMRTRPNKLWTRKTTLNFSSALTQPRHTMHCNNSNPHDWQWFPPHPPHPPHPLHLHPNNPNTQTWP